jgi:hypothetical protein
MSDGITAQVDKGAKEKKYEVYLQTNDVHVGSGIWQPGRVL